MDHFILNEGRIGVLRLRNAQHSCSDSFLGLIRWAIVLQIKNSDVDCGCLWHSFLTRRVFSSSSCEGSPGEVHLSEVDRGCLWCSLLARRLFKASSGWRLPGEIRLSDVDSRCLWCSLLARRLFEASSVGRLPYVVHLCEAMSILSVQGMRF